MSKWREVPIADLCLRTTSGGTPSRKRPDYFCAPPSGVPWIKSQELRDRRITAASEHITEAGLRSSSAKLLPPDTILIAMYGATVGRLGYLATEATVNQAICGLITDPAVADPRFTYYALMNARDDLIAYAHGAAQQNLSQERIRSFPLLVPLQVDEQRSIGVVLRALDDLIENNRRRVQVLEEMAKAIYREWFVDFRYPGHEADSRVESPLGPIPEKWTLTSLSEHVRLRRDNVQPESTPEEPFLHYSIPAFDQTRLPVLENGDQIHSGKYLLGGSCVLLSKLNPRFPRVWRVDPSQGQTGLRAVCSTEFLVLEPVVDWPVPFLSTSWTRRRTTGWPPRSSGSQASCTAAVPTSCYS